MVIIRVKIMVIIRVKVMYINESYSNGNNEDEGNVY